VAPSSRPAVGPRPTFVHHPDSPGARRPAGTESIRPTFSESVIARPPERPLRTDDFRSNVAFRSACKTPASPGRLDGCGRNARPTSKLTPETTSGKTSHIQEDLRNWRPRIVDYFSVRASQAPPRADKDPAPCNPEYCRTEKKHGGPSGGRASVRGTQKGFEQSLALPNAVPPLRGHHESIRIRFDRGAARRCRPPGEDSPR
jgi:hypothetical protein